MAYISSQQQEVGSRRNTTRNYILKRKLFLAKFDKKSKVYFKKREEAVQEFQKFNKLGRRSNQNRLNWVYFLFRNCN